MRVLHAQAVIRIEGAGVFPFTANNLNIFVTAVVSELPNVTANDIVINQVRALLTASHPEEKTPHVRAWP